MIYRPYGEQIRVGPVSTSRTELIDLIKAWIAISLAFSIVISSSVFSSRFMAYFIVSSLTVGLGFIAHELSHKIVAQHYGCFAEFRSFDRMLILAILMSFFGFIIAAPGAVVISGPVGRRRNGKISAAGAIANLTVAAIFLGIGLTIKLDSILFLARYGAMINTWLALFNMIPFWNFDGRKVLNWNRKVYVLMLLLGISFMILNGIVFGGFK